MSIGIFPIGHPSEEDELGRLEDEEEYKSSEEKRHPRKKASSHSLPLVWSDCLIDVPVGVRADFWPPAAGVPDICTARIALRLVVRETQQCISIVLYSDTVHLLVRDF